MTNKGWKVTALVLLLAAAVGFGCWFTKPVYGLEQMVAVWYCEVDGQVARYIERRPESRFDRHDRLLLPVFFLGVPFAVGGQHPQDRVAGSVGVHQFDKAVQHLAVKFSVRAHFWSPWFLITDYCSLQRRRRVLTWACR